MASRDKKIYKIPVLGYILHLVEAFFRLPRNDSRVAQLRAKTDAIERGAHDRSNELRNELADLQGRVALFEDRFDAIEAMVPRVLNAVGTVPALAHRVGKAEASLDVLMDSKERLGTLSEQQQEAIEQMQAEFARRLAPQDERVSANERSIASLWERIEFVRREIFYEFHHGSGLSRSNTAAAMPAKLLDEAKVERMRGEGNLRLNLGCGHITLEGYVNVDMRELPNVDIKSNVGELPFEEGSVDEIFSSHLVEHFPQEALRRKLLPHWFACLKPGGKLSAITPDATAMISAAGAGTYGFEDFREVLFGAQDYDGDYHYNLLSPDSMAELLAEAGFVDIEVPVTGRRNGKCFEFEIYGRKPEA
ncbi:methyltransferase domain-containing protein [Acidimangrovimonas sediminis]|uniref:methyltransferase domain-containing protein n=1 Tax=Acidimangrovimonas sediminis TaxID=2056283 RepID=UPI000C80DA54|nr:methyltransferase domain-containing protein [Acidimangrovimonas sediminis]